MTFLTYAGNIDIAAGDYVRLMPGTLPTQTPLPYIVICLAVSGAKPTQIFVAFVDPVLGPQTVWLDTSWVIGNFRPMPAT